MAQINKLEDMWKSKPDASLDDLELPATLDQEVTRVALR